MAKRLGADVVVEPANAVAEIMRLTGNRGVDVAVEALGHEVTFQNACAVVRNGGTVSSVGVYGGYAELRLPTGGSFMHRKIVTTLCPVGTARMERLMALVQGGKVDLRPLLTHSMKLSETPAGYELFRKREGGVLKIGLRP
jgi:threonine dehydrogenase-like Zn-dependent dehydrogenase